MSKKTDAAWAKIRDGQTRVGYMRENARGVLSLYAQKVGEGVPDEELGEIAVRGAVTYWALSQACALAASGAEELVEIDPMHMNRHQVYLMGQAGSQRHYFGFFGELSTSFADLARLHGATVGDIETEAQEFSETVVKANRNRSAW